jgi:hypothetical protein
MVAGKFHPLPAEGSLERVQAIHGIARLRSTTSPDNIDTAKVHLGEALSTRELNRPPQHQVNNARILMSSIVPVPRVSVRQPSAMSEKQGCRENAFVWCTNFEMHRQASGDRVRQPVGHARSRREPKVATMGRQRQQVVEAVHDR